jgi:hypothetical protein
LDNRLSVDGVVVEIIAAVSVEPNFLILVEPKRYLQFSLKNFLDNFLSVDGVVVVLRIIEFVPIIIHQTPIDYHGVSLNDQ